MKSAVRIHERSALRPTFSFTGDVNVKICMPSFISLFLQPHEFMLTTDEPFFAALTLQGSLLMRIVDQLYFSFNQLIHHVVPDPPVLPSLQTCQVIDQADESTLWNAVPCLLPKF